ncbi:MAG: alpha-amylase family glycosyl hydrolase [Candidatus Limnocylindrales bacterium]|nr:alpha-amylase family glycosyl hydrolase [Candidatus Limnocylindrales bacterium]
MRSFADSDGDGIGDLRGLTEKLDYLNDGDPSTTDDLGVTALWLMPIAASPSYHGYDVTDYKQIEADYGTAEDFHALVEAARERKIAVIVDLVLNHTSIEHPWFQDARTPGSEHDAWYVWSTSAPSVAGPGGQPVWHRDGDRWYYGYFWEGMPDLNVANPAVTAALDDVARFWLEEMGVDGFRLDAARHLIEDGQQLENTPATFAWLEGFRSRVEAVRPDALLVGEVWDATSTAARYVREGALDLAFEFGLASAILSSVRLGDADTIANVQAEVSAAYPPGGYAAFLTNHDQNRTVDVLGRDRAAAGLAATLLLTNPGVPFIYYGEELGLRGRKPDEEIRTPLPWDTGAPGYGFTSGHPWEALAPGPETAAVAAQSDDPTSLLSHYRTLTRLRDAHSALRTGELIPIDDAPRGVYAYLRHDAEETIVVMANLSDEPADDVSLSLAAGPLCGTLIAEPLLGPDGTTASLRPPVVSATGGFDEWAIGRLGPRESLVIAIGR